MKTFLTLALALVLTVSTMAACGCTNQNLDKDVTPTVLPTNEEMWNTTEMPTRSTTEVTRPQVTTDPTLDTTRETIDNGNGGIDDTLNPTVATEETTTSRARNMMPR